MRRSRYLIGASGIAGLLAFAGWLTFKSRDPQVRSVPREAIVATSPGELVIDNARLPDERIKAARDLPLRIEDEELKKLLAYLESPLPQTGRENALVSLNELMEQLRLKGRATHQYGLVLARIIRSPGSDPVVRDYAVQHAVRWMIDSESPGSHSTDPSASADRNLLLSSIGDVLKACSPLEGSAWGTTLNSLRDFRRSTSDKHSIEQVFANTAAQIEAVAQGTQPAYLSNRVAAIQSLPELGTREESRKILRDLISDQQTEVSARLSAIGSLSMMGNPEDIDLLEKSSFANPRLAHAASSAVKRLGRTTLGETKQSP